MKKEHKAITFLKIFNSYIQNDYRVDQAVNSALEYIGEFHEYEDNWDDDLQLFIEKLEKSDPPPPPKGPSNIVITEGSDREKKYSKKDILKLIKKVL